MDEPVCEICFDAFAGEPDGRVPLILVCGHSFCKDCIGNLLASAPAGPEDSRAVKCPLRCLPITYVRGGIGSLPRNWALLHCASDIATKKRVATTTTETGAGAAPRSTTAPSEGASGKAVYEGASFGTGAPAEADRPLPDGAYYIECALTGEVFDVDRGRTSPLVPVVHWGKRSRTNQQFRLAFQPALRDYTITAVHSGLALDVDAASQRDGAPLLQYRAHGRPNQHFRLEAASADEYSIVAVHSAKALDVSFPPRPVIAADGETIPPDLVVRQQTRTGGPSQRFRFIPVS